jgi:UDP-N-acetylmuramoyl-L-alanyl-D-glutamate--2,6-diaminopimelate ligase
MQLKKLLTALTDPQVTGSSDRDITAIAYDSRKVKSGTMFVALRGEHTDGHNFINRAIDAGASAIVSEEPVVTSKAASIVVPDTRAALADIAVRFYQNPSKNLKVAGITGTNGKTTTAFLLKHICETAMGRCGLLGTVRYEIADRILPAIRTTPESLDVQELLYQIRAAGCRAVAMEVSSHALKQDRVRGIEFDAAVFTNLTQDHLDYHRTMAEYFEAKALLFAGLSGQPKKKGKAVINIDDRWGTKLREKLQDSVSVLTYGLGARADFRANNLKIDFRGTTYQLDAMGRTFLVRLPLIGRFNVYNSLAAIASAVSLGIDIRQAVLSLANASFVPGRLEAVPAKRQFRVFVDYAHTDDALRSVLGTLRELNPHRLIVVFGCGGSRDRSKRPLMARAVEELADYAIITSDNPRKEEPEAIIDDVKKGFSGESYEVVVDRREAIYRAVAMAQPRDILLLAGKGHETYQEFADHTIPFDDGAIALEALQASPVDF